LPPTVTKPLVRGHTDDAAGQRAAVIAAARGGRVPAASVDILRAVDRFVTAAEGVETHHCFSFGEHYDPANTSFGQLVAFNDIALRPGAGFPVHRHVGVEIVSWVLAGIVHHEDSTGHRGDIEPGVVQRLRAGAGVEHTETAGESAATAEPSSAGTRLLQMWLRADEPEGQPDYAQRVVDPAALATGLALVAGAGARDRSSSAVPLACQGAALLVGRLAPGQLARLPAAERVFVYIARGSVAMSSGHHLAEGDSARLTGDSHASLRGLRAAEVLVWGLDSVGRTQ
jgi:redox-sensitive bicupin YhaK (pirin superfamily)